MTSAARRVLAFVTAPLLALGLLAAPAVTQFSEFAWELGGNLSGWGWVTEDLLHVEGPWGATCGDYAGLATHMTTTAPEAGTVSAHIAFDNQDGGFGSWLVEMPIYLIDGEVHVIGGPEFFDFSTTISFHVEAGQSFGFGEQATDCKWGPGVVDVTEFSFTPDSWLGLPGSNGIPSLVWLGEAAAGEAFTLSLVDAHQSATAWLITGLTELGAPFKGGVLVPDPTPPGFVVVLVTSPLGRIILNGVFPPGVPAGTELIFQYWIADPLAPQGYSASNAVAVEAD